MVQRCAYLGSVHNILSKLVVNIDQTGIHLVPTCDSITQKRRLLSILKYINKMKKKLLWQYLLQPTENAYFFRQFSNRYNLFTFVDFLARSRPRRKSLT